jgi:hypothetical protein
MAGTPGHLAFAGYALTAGLADEDVLPWAEQDQKVWDKAAASVKLREAATEETDQSEDQPEELSLDAAHQDG